MADKDEQVKQVANNVVESLAKIEESFRLAKLDLLKQETALFRPLYQKREKLTSAIPRFWGTVLSIEDELTPFIGESEADLLKSCKVLRIERLEDPRDFSLTLEFAPNEYLNDSSLQKTFKFDGGRLTSEQVKLTWKQGKDLVSQATSQDRTSFFALFSFVGTTDEDSHDEDGEDGEEDAQLVLEDMAMLLADEVYPHALSYFTDALAPPDTPSPSTPVSRSMSVDQSGAGTPFAIESMTSSFLDQQARVKEQQPTVSQVGLGKSHQLATHDAHEGVKTIESYASDSSTPIPEFLMSHRRDSIASFNELKMITINQSQFLMFLISTLKPQRVLEIGCFTGFSAMCMAYAGASEVITCEIDESLSSFAKLGVFKYTDKLRGRQVKVLTGDAHALMKDRHVVDGPFDLVFLDAEKGGYVDYLQEIMRLKLLSEGGLVIADNTLRRGCVATGRVPERNKVIESRDERLKNDDFEEGVEAIRAFNEFVRGHEKLESVLVPVYDGMTLIRYRSS